MALVVLCGVSFYVYKTNDMNETYENKEIKNDSNMLSMMLETSAGSGEYKETTSSTWPGDGYVFNTTLSKCKSGSNLSWDNDKKQVIFDGINKDECYVYFNIYTTLLSEFIKSQYTGIQGTNNLYLHDSSLTNGAGDNSYRFAGSSETTNNFVCFGYDSTDGTCPTDYLYRIIGVFDDQVKLIKYDYAKSTLLGTDGDYYNTYLESNGRGTTKGNNSTSEIGVYYWNNNTQSNVWSESKLNTVNLNRNFLKNIGIIWSSKIATHTWKVAGNIYGNIGNATVSNAYKNEIVSPPDDTTYEAKIGLMYASDYGYTTLSNTWTNTLKSYSDSSIKNSSWMYMGLYDWTISRGSDTSNATYYIDYDGGVLYTYVYSTVLATRPVFYLNSDVLYISGNGTKTEPFLIVTTQPLYKKNDTNSIK